MGLTIACDGDSKNCRPQNTGQYQDTKHDFLKYAIFIIEDPVIIKRFYTYLKSNLAPQAKTMANCLIMDLCELLTFHLTVMFGESS